MKKLLISTDSFLPRWDGISRFLEDLIPHLKEEFEITVLAPEFEGDEPVIEGVKLFRFPLLKIRFGDIHFSKFQFKKISDIVKEHDIIFNQTIGPIGIATIRAASKQNKPVISFIHSLEWELTSKSIDKYKVVIERATKTLARHLYNKCTLLLTPTQKIKKILSEQKINTKKKVVHLGVNVVRFHPVIDKSEAKVKVGLNPKSLVIGYCGRIGREKNLETLHKAYIDLKQKKNLALLIIGSGPENQMKELEGEDITLTGMQNDVIPYLQAMDIFVLPSLTETSSLATMEAMACGLAVICTPVGYIKEYLKNGRNGFTFPRKSVSALKKRLTTVIENKQIRNKLSKNARRTMVSHHRWHYTVNDIVEVLKEF